MFGLAGSQWNKTVAQQEQETTLSYFSAFHSVFWHAAELILLIPAKLWTVKFVKIQWTLQSKKEGKGDNAVSFFFFFSSRPHTFCGIHIHCINDDLLLHSAHKQQQNWNSTNWRATHCDFFSKYAVMLCCCWFHLLQEIVWIDLLKAGTLPSGVLSLLEDFQKYGWMPLSKAFLQQYFPYNLTKHS